MGMEQEAASSGAPGNKGFGGSDVSVGSKRKFDGGVKGDIVGKGAGVPQPFLQGKGKYGAESSFSTNMSGGKGGDSTQGGPAKKAKTMCQYYLQGSCKWGAECYQSHG